LGWCYRRGLGVPRDLHLAKRHYGLATDADAYALWPVRIAVSLVYAEWGLQEIARRRPGIPVAVDGLHLPATSGKTRHSVAVTLLAALFAIIAAKVVRQLARLRS